MRRPILSVFLVFDSLLLRHQILVFFAKSRKITRGLILEMPVCIEFWARNDVFMAVEKIGASDPAFGIGKQILISHFFYRIPNLPHIFQIGV